MDDIFKTVPDILKTGEDAVLIRVVSAEGSTPRPAGARMMISRNGRITGTIGGGVVDGTAKKMAVEAFESACSSVTRMDLYPEETAGADMICGGSLEILCEYVPSDDRSIADFQSLGAGGGSHRKRILCTEFDDSGERLRTVRRFLMEDGDNGRVFQATPEFRKKLMDAGRNVSGSAMAVLDGRTYCIDAIETKEPVFIFGAGHVAKQVAALAMNVGFRVIVLDDRDEFANAEHFPAPAEVVVLGSFEGCFQNLSVDEHSYVVIVTRGHAHDKTVLGQALKTPAGYIGMIGSRKKRDTIYRSLMEEGFAKQEIEKVHCPIGLPIDTETPEEIAVSIVGQLIDVRAQKRR